MFANLYLYTIRFFLYIHALIPESRHRKTVLSDYYLSNSLFVRCLLSTPFLSVACCAYAIRRVCNDQINGIVRYALHTLSTVIHFLHVGHTTQQPSSWSECMSERSYINTQPHSGHVIFFSLGGSLPSLIILIIRFAYFIRTNFNCFNSLMVSGVCVFIATFNLFMISSALPSRNPLPPHFLHLMGLVYPRSQATTPET